MATEDLFVDNGGNGETVEAVGKRFPQLDIESSFAWKKKFKKNSSNDSSF